MSARSGAMMSKVGNPQIYEAKEQRTSKHTDHNPPKKHDKGQEHPYIDIDSKDERSIGDAIAAAHKYSRMNESTNPSADPRVDPLGPATAHGNKPSRGAKVDAEIMAEEEEEVRNKGKA
ncbi:hypothetical protein F5I97DRAFT_1928193 [Phlebopus sp. FC_14]|nr:hypothetical protein F5I97DRAFT_1928193 [Phlebopus sp. FC_14]